MPRFDPDTIAALAEGRLTEEEAARIEREIANDPAALAELDAHRTALSAMANASEFRLSELERAGLHASVADALGLVETAPQASTTPRRVPWGSLGIAAAALFGLVAVVPVVGLLNTAGDDDAAGTALAPVATTSADFGQDGMAETDTSSAETASIVADEGFDASQEAPGDDVVGFGSTTTASARVTTTSIEESAIDTTSTTLDPAATPDPAIDQLVADLTSLREDVGAIAEVAALALQEDQCWVEDTTYRGGEDPGDRWVFQYEGGEKAFVIYFQYDAEGLPGPFKVYSTPECSDLLEVPEAP